MTGYQSKKAAAQDKLAQPEQEQALLDAIVGGTGVMLGDKRIDPASIYKQPEQEPVGEVTEVSERGFKCEFSQRLAAGTKLYTTPPQRKPLEGVIEIKPIGYHSLQLIFESQTAVKNFREAHGIKDGA